MVRTNERSSIDSTKIAGNSHPNDEGCEIFAIIPYHAIMKRLVLGVNGMQLAPLCFTGTPPHSLQLADVPQDFLAKSQG